jgi:hypothetical protein
MTDLQPNEQQLAKINKALEGFDFMERDDAMKMVMAYFQSHTLRDSRNPKIMLGCLPPNLTAFVALAKRKPISPEDEKRHMEQEIRSGDALVARVQRDQRRDARQNKELLGG